MTVRTTYFWALSNQEAEPAADDVVYSVVRYTQDWIDDLVERNIDALAPPSDLLDAYKQVEDAAEEDGYSNPSQVAWESVNFAERYQQHLTTVDQVVDVVAEQAAETTVWLVCWEKDDRYCHRRLLADAILDRLDDSSLRLTSTGIGRTCPECGIDAICSTREFERTFRLAAREPDARRVLDSDAEHICSNCFAGFGGSR
ncbi:DUF488 family protein [Halohasta litorea]|uniref:DUF488 family protein n=1 Tax=Halohasta litorea TaxID=869891 RepID=A0ABD6D5B7_9EURY|nr:DUF488 family protein [Halohasta litorea]